MKLTTHKSNIRTIRQDSPDFRMVDGFTVVPRAGFEISQSCPAEYKSIFITAINAGWLKPVAHMRDYELMWDKLNEQA
jgi:hypothetical protein